MRPVLAAAATLLATALALASAAPVVSTAQTLAGGPQPRLAPVAAAPAPAMYPSPAFSQGPAPSSVIRVDLGAQGGATQSLSLPLGKSATIELPVNVRDVMVTNPKVAESALLSQRQISLLGQAPGQTDAVFFDANGRRILTLDIRVDQDVGALAATIRKVLPGANIEVQSINESVILTGLVQNAVDADRAGQIAARYVAKPENVLNMISIAGKDQVVLKVRIVEMQRSVIKQFGVNLSAVLGQVGGVQYNLANAASYAVNGGLLGGLSGGYNVDTTKQPVLKLPCTPGDWTNLCPTVVHSAADASNYNAATITDVPGSSGVNKAAATLQAFERVGLARTLAEPNVTCVSGESCHTLVGGEYPVPTGSDSTGKTTIEFKPYGIGLGFTPVVLSSGKIAIKLSTEVSELSTNGSFSLATGTGANASTLTIPALTVTRAENAIELPSGGSMMIAGLIQEKTRQNIDSLPGMTNLPILGALARSRDFQQGQTELVIIATAYIVGATRPDQLQTPADGLQIASDAETLLLGRLNRVYHAKPQASAGRTYQGPFGYVVE